TKRRPRKGPYARTGGVELESNHRPVLPRRFFRPTQIPTHTLACCGSLWSEIAPRNQTRWESNQGHGAQGGNRTTDTAIFSRMLYQLSYLGVPRKEPFGHKRAGGL